MSKKDAKVSEAQLPMPPAVEAFIGALEEWKGKKPDEPRGSNMFGDDSDNEDQIGKPANTKKAGAVAVNVAMQFQRVSEANNQVYKSLDDWLVGFVKFTVDVRAMNSEKDKQKKYPETRKQLCGEEYKVRSLSPSTIKTYINALAGIYNTRRQENQFVPSSNMRFPGFNSYYAHVDKLFKVIDAIKEAENPEEEILQDAELEKLWEDTNFQSVFEVQRYNIMIFAYVTGFRGDTLQHMLTKTFERGTDEHGKYLKPKIGTMKNRPAGFQSERDLFDQEVRPCIEDERFCPIAAYERQCSLDREPNPDTEDYLFRSITSVTSKVLLKKPTSANTYRGVANWVSKVVDRKLTFKSIARWVVMTKLANANDISLHDAAKHVGVVARTLGVYHRKGKQVKSKSSNALEQT